MGYELDKLMKRFGVSTATLPQYSGAKAPSETAIPDAKAKSDVLLTSSLKTDTKTPVKYYTAPVAPTAPVMPVAPENTLGVKPVITDYDALNPKWTALPTATNQKTATGDALTTAQDQWTKYQTDLNDWNAKNNAAISAQKTYDASLKSYPNLMKTYNTDLTKYNTDKTTWDELQRKYDLDQKSYNNYVDEYKNRIANTPQYDPLPQGVVQTRPNVSMGQTSIPVTTSPVTPAINNPDISQWASKNPYATMQDAQNQLELKGYDCQDDYFLESVEDATAEYLKAGRYAQIQNLMNYAEENDPEYLLINYRN